MFSYFRTVYGSRWIGFDGFFNKRKGGTKTWLGGGFRYFFFDSLFGEDEPILTNIFQMGWFNHQLGGVFFSVSANG